jgi:hypothetical protein
MTKISIPLTYEKRFEALEKQNLATVGTGSTPTKGVTTYPPFDFNGPLSITTTDSWCPVTDTAIGQFAFTFGAVSSANVQVGVVKNDVLVETLTIPAATKVFLIALSSPFSLVGGNDYMSLRILDPGSGGSGLVGTPG